MEWARILAYITGTVDQQLLVHGPGDARHCVKKTRKRHAVRKMKVGCGA
jgi:hypothetical protein